jgi:hypothetical protein
MTMSSEQHEHWHQLALIVSQLGVAPDQWMPVERVEELANLCWCCSTGSTRMTLWSARCP